MLSAGGADIFKRRLLALCSDVFETNDTVLYEGYCKVKIAEAIFDAYLGAHPTATLEDLRQAFPVAINDTVARYYDHLFYELPTVYNEGGELKHKAFCGLAHTFPSGLLLSPCDGWFVQYQGGVACTLPR
jgi:hypothetical protein